MLFFLKKRSVSGRAKKIFTSTLSFISQNEKFIAIDFTDLQFESSSTTTAHVKSVWKVFLITNSFSRLTQQSEKNTVQHT